MGKISRGTHINEEPFRRIAGLRPTTVGYLIPPEFTGSTSQSGTSIAVGLTVDATAAVGDDVDIRYRAVGSGTWIAVPTNTLDATEAAAPFLVAFVIPDLTPDDYEFQAMHSRATPLAESAWSDTFTITLSAASGSTATMFMMLQAA